MSHLYERSIFLAHAALYDLKMQNLLIEIVSYKSKTQQSKSSDTNIVYIAARRHDKSSIKLY